MIKFIHKEHIKNDEQKGKIIIYYSYLDIILGIILFGLIVFFVRDYLTHSLYNYQNNDSGIVIKK